MALFGRSRYGGWFSRDRAYDREPAVARGGYYAMLTPPSLPLFLVSAVIAAGVLLFHYAHIDVPLLKTSNVFDALAIAYAVLFAGVVLRGL